MRGALLALLLLPPAPARAAGTADWRAARLEDEQLDGLRRLGFRLEDDGRVLSPQDGAVLDDAALAEALRELAAGRRRAALERLRALLAAQPADRELSPAARAQASRLAAGPLAAEILSGRATAAHLRRIAELDLASVAAAFDGALVRAGVAASGAASGRRAPFPYLSDEERRAGESLRAAAAAELGRTARGRELLDRLAAPSGRLDLPPILVEPLGETARYDPRRGALVLDRDVVVAAIIDGKPGPKAAAERRALERPGALAARLAADPSAARAVLAREDVLVFHELTHAWQHRRDPLYREMLRGRIPEALVLEYEEEAFVAKNLYLHEKLSRFPGARVDPHELDDYRRMARDFSAWRKDLFERYRAVAPASASTLSDLRTLQAARMGDAARRAPSLGRYRELRGIDRGMRALAGVEVDHRQRMAAVAAELPTLARESAAALALHWLEAARTAPNPVEARALLARAEEEAARSGDPALLERVRAARRAAP